MKKADYKYLCSLVRLVERLNEAIEMCQRLCDDGVLCDGVLFVKHMLEGRRNNARRLIKVTCKELGVDWWWLHAHAIEYAKDSVLEYEREYYYQGDRIRVRVWVTDKYTYGHWFHLTSIRSRSYRRLLRSEMIQRASVKQWRDSALVNMDDIPF